jgi:hypothetical protein
MASAPLQEDALKVFGLLQTEPFESCEAAWRAGLAWLRLSLTYVPAIKRVLDQGRWRAAANSVAYVRKAATREAIRMRLFDLTGRDPKKELVVSDVALTRSNGKAVPHDEAIDILAYDPSNVYRHNDYDISPVWEVDDSLLTESGSLDIDWDHVVEVAGLDEGQKMVIAVRLLGLGREQALGACRTAEDRRMLQSAWKRFERHQGTLQATLRSGKPYRARRISRKNPEPPMELVLIQTRLRTQISFKKLVPQKPFSSTDTVGSKNRRRRSDHQPARRQVHSQLGSRKKHPSS